MELQDVAHFGPEVSRQVLKQRVPRQPMIEQLQHHETDAGQHRQQQVLPGAGVPELTLHTYSLVHSEGDVTTEGRFEPASVHQCQAVAEDGAQLGGYGVARKPSRAVLYEVAPHGDPREDRLEAPAPDLKLGS